MGQLGDLSPQGSIAIGIVVGLLSTSLQSLGLTLQRKSHLLEEEKQQHEIQRPPYRRRRWQIGMFLFIISNIVGSTIQIATLPLPVLSTLQAAGLVFNTAFATLLLHEPFTRYSFAGTVLVCGGAFLIGYYGAIGEPAHNLKQLIYLLGRWQFIVWMVGTLLVAFLTLVLGRFLHYLSKKVHEQHEYSKERERLESSGIDLGNDNMDGSMSLHKRPTLPLNVPVPNSIRSSRLRMLRGLSYALISGILSAHSLLVAKSAVELVIRSLVPPRQNQFNQYQSYLILLALLFFALSQLYYLHCGLRLCSTSVLYPFVFCIYNIIAILDGLIYFDQSSQLTPLDAGLVALGTIVLLAGVLCLSWRLEEFPPIAPATGPATVDPEAPLGSPEENTTDPGLEATETTSLLSHSHSHRRRRSTTRSNRRPTLSLLPPHMAPPAGPDTRTPTSAQLWAELDDSDTDESFVRPSHLAHKPHTDFNVGLHTPKQRRRMRGHSVHTDVVTPGRVTFADDTVDVEAQTKQAQPRRASAPFNLASNGLTSASRSGPKDSTEPSSSNPTSPTFDNGDEVDRPTKVGDVDVSDMGSGSTSAEAPPAEEDNGWIAAPRRWASWFYTDVGNGKAKDQD